MKLWFIFQSCSGWRLNQLPEVKRFIYDLYFRVALHDDWIGYQRLRGLSMMIFIFYFRVVLDDDWIGYQRLRGLSLICISELLWMTTESVTSSPRLRGLSMMIFTFYFRVALDDDWIGYQRLRVLSVMIFTFYFRVALDDDWIGYQRLRGLSMMISLCCILSWIPYCKN